MKKIAAEIQRLERFVAEGKADRALEGYERLLATLPRDPVLQNRVNFLRDSLHRHAPQWQVSTYVISPQAVAEAYVMQQRFPEALEILEWLLELHPTDTGLARRVAMVRAMRDGLESAGIEPTASTQLMTPDMLVEAHTAAGEIHAALRLLKALVERRPTDEHLRTRLSALEAAWGHSADDLDPISSSTAQDLFGDDEGSTVIRTRDLPPTAAQARRAAGIASPPPSSPPQPAAPSPAPPGQPRLKRGAVARAASNWSLAESPAEPPPRAQPPPGVVKGADTIPSFDDILLDPPEGKGSEVFQTFQAPTEPDAPPSAESPRTPLPLSTELVEAPPSHETSTASPEPAPPVPKKSAQPAAQKAAPPAAQKAAPPAAPEAAPPMATEPAPQSPGQETSVQRSPGRRQRRKRGRASPPPARGASNALERMLSEVQQTLKRERLEPTDLDRASHGPGLKPDPSVGHPPRLPASSAKPEKRGARKRRAGASEGAQRPAAPQAKGAQRPAAPQAKGEVRGRRYVRKRPPRSTKRPGDGLGLANPHLPADAPLLGTRRSDATVANAEPFLDIHDMLTMADHKAPEVARPGQAQRPAKRVDAPPPVAPFAGVLSEAAELFNDDDDPTVADEDSASDEGGDRPQRGQQSERREGSPPVRRGRPRRDS